MYYINKLLTWYQKQLFMAQCTDVGQGLKFVGTRPLDVFVGENGNLILGRDVTVKCTCRLYVTTHVNATSKLEIGDRVRLGNHTWIRAAESITIGDDCLIAPYVRIYDYNGHPLKPFDPADPSIRRNRMDIPASEVRPIVIEENVWVGENAFIQKGVTIGANSIIGANSVVIKDVPRNVIAFGNPARVIGWLDSMKHPSEQKTSADPKPHPGRYRA